MCAGTPRPDIPEILSKLSNNSSPLPNASHNLKRISFTYKQKHQTFDKNNSFSLVLVIIYATLIHKTE
jgi:hypothetical protein